LPRLQRLDLDDANSEIGGGAMQKSVSNTDVFQHRQKKFDYDEFQSKFLEQQSVAKDRKTKSSAKAAAILGLKKGTNHKSLISIPIYSANKNKYIRNNSEKNSFKNDNFCLISLQKNLLQFILQSFKSF
jgi:hypothetical protein